MFLPVSAHPSSGFRGADRSLLDRAHCREYQSYCGCKAERRKAQDNMAV